MNRIVIAHGHTSIEILHSLVPFFLASEKTKNNWDWNFLDYRVFNLFKMQGDLLIIVRRYHDNKRSNQEIEKELLSFKKNFKKVIYFDDSAATSVILFNIFEFVDAYWKRSIFKNINLYKKQYYGGHLFSHFYNSNFSIDDEKKSFFNETSEGVDLTKLKVAWNIGVGAFPVSRNNFLNAKYVNIRKLTTGMSILPSIAPVRSIIKLYLDNMKKELDIKINSYNKDEIISGRFESSMYRNSIGYQRLLMQKKIMNNNLFLTGKIDRWSFTKEAAMVRGMLSPFGWGEVCYRDFEAALGGAILIKPDMSHVDTWPNIFIDKSYIPLSWDLDELTSFKLKESNYDYVNISREIYLNSLNSIEERAIQMIEE
jgi:hypothetical protein